MLDAVDFALDVKEEYEDEVVRLEVSGEVSVANVSQIFRPCCTRPHHSPGGTEYSPTA